MSRQSRWYGPWREREKVAGTEACDCCVTARVVSHKAWETSTANAPAKQTPSILYLFLSQPTCQSIYSLLKRSGTYLRWLANRLYHFLLPYQPFVLSKTHRRAIILPTPPHAKTGYQRTSIIIALTLSFGSPIPIDMYSNRGGCPIYEAYESRWMLEVHSNFVVSACPVPT